ncbi:OmpA family protein [Rubrivivax gelatinosus]|uniref:OmpA family protein n=1 Tax=Rubrivivax gelatinosus TaxID=28068 RepID=UPI0009D993A6|nr:OmpA family protein [Rubrivivax gelatinosus]MBG6081758.1 outer membrane protein OmpA-like peptidoglycan-associated protein [Rubrivivax gelatinosus]
MNAQQISNRLARTWLAALGVWLVAMTAGIGSAHAQAAPQDHPLLSRVAGTELMNQTVLEFSVVEPYVAGKLVKGSPTSFEGRVTRTDYGTLNGTAPGEIKIYRSYLAAAKKLGGRPLNDGINFNDPGALVTGAHVFTLSAADKPPVAVLNITNAHNYMLTIVEPSEMEEAVTAGQLADQIKKTGVATLHINFDTGKSDLKTDGQAAVREIAALLKADPSLKLAIEGHTDNVGSAAANRQLSAARAKSVMVAVAAAGVDAKRLSATGYGMDRPVADNSTEDGRAKNRRVDLVKVK